jgi:hypothetical protein
MRTALGEDPMTLDALAHVSCMMCSLRWRVRWRLEAGEELDGPPICVGCACECCGVGEPEARDGGSYAGRSNLEVGVSAMRWEMCASAGRPWEGSGSRDRASG